MRMMKYSFSSFPTIEYTPAREHLSIIYRVPLNISRCHTCCRYQPERERPLSTSLESSPNREAMPSATLAFVTPGSNASC